MDFTLQELYVIKNGLFNLDDCKVLDKKEKEYLSILIDLESHGKSFTLVCKENSLPIRCEPKNYGKRIQKTN